MPKIVVCVGEIIPGYPEAIKINHAALILLEKLLIQDDPSGKIAKENILKDFPKNEYVVKLPRHHPRLVQLVEICGSSAGGRSCFPMVINIRDGKYIIKRTDMVEFICDPISKKQL